MSLADGVGRDLMISRQRQHTRSHHKLRFLGSNKSEGGGGGKKGDPLVQEVVYEWEDIVNSKECGWRKDDCVWQVS